MKAINVTARKELAAQVAVAKNILKRIKGLLGKSEFNIGEALWIEPCNSIHTFCMKFPIDVVFLNKKNQVIAIRKSLYPNRITPVYIHAAGVLELPEGIVVATSTRVGDEIEFA